MKSTCRAFTILELAMVVVVSGLMLGYVLKTTQTVNRQDCYVETKQKLLTIRASVERFARRNDRLPLPAARNIGPESPNYGRESSGANIDQIGAGVTGVSFGAVPFQALGLTTEYAGDCWGNKFTYVVTTALTTNAASGGYLDTTVTGNIAVKTTTAVTNNATAAYAIISHGEDALGAVKLGYTAANGANTPPYAGHGWCSGAATLATMNCRALAAEVADAVFNNGKDAGASYFDDLVISAGRPLLLPTGTSNAYCWGRNNDGQLGIGNTTNKQIPTLISGTDNFIHVAVGGDALFDHGFACGITSEGKVYCWGYNGYGQFGNGGTTASNTPTLAAGGAIYSQIEASGNNLCALNAAGAAYCWGYGDSKTANCGSTNCTSPFMVAGGNVFTRLAVAPSFACGLKSNGEVWCWGDNGYGGLGNGGGPNSGTPSKATGTGAGSMIFKTIAASPTYDTICGVSTTGDAYCWGRGDEGQIGDGAWSSRNVPTLVSAGGQVWSDISVAGRWTCALNTAGAAYCWGSDWNGGIGNNTTNNYNTPQAVHGGLTFTALSGGDTHICGLLATGEEYCWGYSIYGEIGNNTIRPPDALTPQKVTGSGTWPLVFSQTRGGRSLTCAVQPPPPVVWGDNSYGQLGDNTQVNKATPIYMTMPTGVNYFTDIRMNTAMSCALSDTGKGYCAGYNLDGRIGDGSTGSHHLLLGPVTMPGGVTFKYIEPGQLGGVAISTTNLPYFWGVGYYMGSPFDKATPFPVTVASTTVKSGQAWEWGAWIGSDDQAYNYGGAGYGNPALVALPGGVTSVKAIGAAPSGNRCLMGNDNQIYCNGESGPYSARGDGSVAINNSTFTAVTLPAADGVTYWTALSVGDAGGGWSFQCAIADTGDAYCWGYGGTGCLGNGAGGIAYVPTKVTKPTGVNSWKSIYVGYSIVTAIGDNGVAYYWGQFDPSAGYTLSPTPIPLPPGARGFKQVNGRTGLVY